MALNNGWKICYDFERKCILWDQVWKYLLCKKDMSDFILHLKVDVNITTLPS